MAFYECVIHGSEAALRISKENIEKWFPMVVVFELRELSMKVMETVLPQFFRNILKLFFLGEF